MYLLTKGSIVISYKGLKFQVLTSQSFIGEHYLILGCKPAYLYNSGANGVNVMTIRNDHLLELLDEHPKAYEWFKKISIERRIKLLELRRIHVERHNN